MEDDWGWREGQKDYFHAGIVVSLYGILRQELLIPDTELKTVHARTKFCVRSSNWLTSHIVIGDSYHGNVSTSQT